VSNQSLHDAHIHIALNELYSNSKIISRLLNSLNYT
jgi:hypothetical protein